MSKNIVQTSWLINQLQETPKQLQTIDCSWYVPSMGRNAYKEYLDDHVPSAKYFDFSQCTDTTNPLPHMLPNKQTFESYIKQQGISKTTPIVVYDGLGIFSAPRVWFMFKAYGVDDVAVLDGGFPKYKTEASSISIDENSAEEELLVLPKDTPKDNVIDLDSLLSLLEGGLENKKSVVIDARGEVAFSGLVPDAREEYESGHIPQSINIPIAAVVEKGKFKEKKDIEDFLNSKGYDVEKWKSDDIEQVIFSCGSGVTACIPMLALVTMFDLPFEKCKLYDGSWSEYGQKKLNLDIAKG
eukprot:maker-scaffold_50-snap-gene-0.4-mRNA-1 protein AED:0.04 eAED:0.04 QI:94/1/1/1/0.5/0.33/3/166/297